MKLLKLLLVFLLSGICSFAQVAPQVYYTFDLGNPLAPTIGVTNLSGGGTYSIAPGKVGNALLQNNSTSTLMNGQSVPSSQTIVVEFIFKADYQWSNNRDQQLFSIGSTSAKFIYPELRFATSVVSGGFTESDNFAIRMDGVGPKSWKYYNSGWHHMVFMYEAATGRKTIFVDGVSPTGFTKIVNPGTISPGANNNLTLSSNTSYLKAAQYIDEIAVYNRSISVAQVCGNYQDIVAGNHYDFTLAVGCGTTAITAALDSMEYPLGHTIGSPNSANVTRTALTQLKNYVLPRWPEARDAPWNVNWLQLNYMAGQYQPGVNNLMVLDTGSALNIELTTNWNYSFQVNTNFISYLDYDDTTRWGGKMVAVSNRNKQWPTHILSFWNQLNPTSAQVPGGRTRAYVFSQDNPNNHYLRNSSGQFISSSGAVTTTKILQPAMPLDSLRKDAKGYKTLFDSLAAYMQDTLDLISENDEVLPIIQSSALGQDPLVLAGMTSAGYSQARKYLGYAHWQFNKLWQDSVRSNPAFDSTAITEYQIDGEDSTGGVPYARVYFEERRKINSDPLFDSTSTVDIYPRYPWNWRFNIGAYRGWQPLVNARNTEEGLGVKYFTPFVSPGWAENEETNLRPGQWLGFLKCMAAAGARRWYIAYFNTNSDYNPPNPPPFNPKGYAWDAVMPVYAQAATDWVIGNGAGDTLMPGDMPQSYVTDFGNSYTYYSGNPEILTVVRKRTVPADSIQYTVATSLQKMSNMTQAITDTAIFTVEGRTFNLETRRQGSVYTIDLNRDSAVIVQWDGYQPYYHPDRWNSDMYFEAEHDTEYVSAAQDIRTFPAIASASDTFNLSGFTTYISYKDSATYSRDTLDYNFTLRTPTTLNLWVRMRSATVNQNSGFSARMDNGAAFTQNLVLDTAFKWYRIGIASATDTMRWTSVSTGSHTLKLRATSTQSEIDQFVLTPNSLSLPEGVPGQANPCAVAPVPIISPASPITQCGGTVILTCSAATNYLWSTGATTRAITASATGSYSVTITAGSGCTGTSAAHSVTINPAATATISPSGTVNNCLGSQVLTAFPGSSYLWSSGETTRSVTKVAGGTFTVTVTNFFGCTAVSAPVILTVNTPVTPTITPSGVVSACNGTPTLLTASSGISYLWSTGAVSQSIQPTLSARYSVIVTDANGCTATSSETAVTFSAAPTVTITQSLVNFCTGTPVLLTASGAANYLWSNGAITDTTTVSTSATYTVTGTSVAGCTNTASVAATFVNCDCEPPAIITVPKINAYNARIAWTPVVGATGYQVVVTDMSTLNGSVKVWRQTTTGLWITKLRPERRYKVEIQTLCNTSIFSAAQTIYFVTKSAL